jgi:hypothetical protein
MKNLVFVWLAATVITLGACNGRRGAGGAGTFEDVIVFDYKENYPKSELTFADIAELNLT